MGGTNSNEKNSQVMLLGLEQTGKSTFLKRVLETVKPNKEDSQMEPTLGFNFASIPISTVTYDVWDLGGDTTSRSFWNSFYRALQVNLVVFFIDITDKDSFSLSLKELLRIINEEELKTSRFFILFNCFLPGNTMVDETVYNSYKDEGDFLLKQLKEYPIHEYEARVAWDIIDVKKANFNEAFLEKCFTFAKAH